MPGPPVKPLVYTPRGGCGPGKAWVDLRATDMERWRGCFREILRQDREMSGATSSLYDRGQSFWQRADGEEVIIDPGEVAGWILTYEEKGERMKD